LFFEYQKQREKIKDLLIENITYSIEEKENVSTNENDETCLLIGPNKLNNNELEEQALHFLSIAPMFNENPFLVYIFTNFKLPNCISKFIPSFIMSTLVGISIFGFIFKKDHCPK